MPHNTLSFFKFTDGYAGGVSMVAMGITMPWIFPRERRTLLSKWKSSWSKSYPTVNISISKILATNIKIPQYFQDTCGKLLLCANDQSVIVPIASVLAERLVDFIQNCVNCQWKNGECGNLITVKCWHLEGNFAIKVGLKSRFQSLIEFAFSVLLETRKSLLCVQSIFRRILILYIRQKWI